MWQTILVAALTAIVTTLLTEPLKNWLNRGQIARQKRFDEQTDGLKAYLQLLGEANDACLTTFAGFRARDVPAFQYARLAADSLSRVINLGNTIGDIMPDDIKATMNELRDLNWQLWNVVAIENCEDPPPTDITQELMSRFQSHSLRLQATRQTLRKRYDEMLGGKSKQNGTTR